MGKLNNLPTIANMLYPNMTPLDIMPLPSVNLSMPTPTHAPNLLLFASISRFRSCPGYPICFGICLRQ
uniref:Uncharacterized protein n=1 Tax=Picea glauca TaxID=3330 RepID=A0A101LYJ2_PICGL|nr:hypothetical protein ABT39_MTgene5916 [Picea glauca]QHR92051.1 hypothetical protein Q903MT_gene6087 [Picea sitchensis]